MILCPEPPSARKNVETPDAAFLKESRTRCHGWGRAVGNPGPLRFLQRVGYATVGIEVRGIPPFAKSAKDPGAFAAIKWELQKSDDDVVHSIDGFL
jgi:hypothetical protein